MRFNDGMEFDTSGSLRTVRRSDGLYVVGRGMLIPVNDYTEARNMIKSLTRKPRVIVEVVPDTEESVISFIQNDTDLIIQESSTIKPCEVHGGVWKVTDVISQSGIVGMIVVYLAGYEIGGTGITRTHSDFECTIE